MLRAITGSDYVIENPELQVDRRAPALLVEPASAQEVAACLGVCSELNAAVVPAGRATWLDGGNPLRRADVLLSLERMGRVIDYSPPDLTVTVEAGMRLHAFNEMVNRDRLWLPLDPPGADAASVGAVVACNSSGALRCGYGTPRDYVIGLKLAHTDGRESKSGGRVVKNVAGYDLNKLYVGSFGTLAVITEVTFKLRPLPEQCVTVALMAHPSERITGLARQIIATELQPVACVLSFATGAESLLLRFADNTAAVKAQRDELQKARGKAYQTTEVSGAGEAALWAKLNDLDCASQIALRMSVPLSKTVDLYEDLINDKAAAVMADLGSGIVRAAMNATAEVAATIKQRRAAVAKLGGTLFIEKAPLEVKRQVDAWGEVGTSVRLMHAVKEKFDPHGILNPGRFIAEI
ncbi:MAG TPA: FAD-binding oxidoreductase [Blastocatellia bacterium]|nr:FAD-binding oxidoreductase [Blastocatellia bacterium]